MEISRDENAGRIYTAYKKHLLSGAPEACGFAAQKVGPEKKTLTKAKFVLQKQKGWKRKIYYCHVTHASV